ncbi:MAG: hypothetical protein JST93_01675 [Acidobacteria bacterium]|nr:hypothetical protein [Acidobacteriota bacterium]
MKKDNKIIYVGVITVAMGWQMACGGSKPAAETATSNIAPAVTDAKPVAAPAPAPPPRPAPIVIDAGTNIRVRSTTTLSTKNNAAGDAFHGSLDAPLTVDGKVVAEKGARVQGVVASSDPGGRVKGVASISVRLTSIETGKGPVAVRTNTLAHQARTTKKNDAIKVGIGSGIGAAIGAIAGGGKGAAIGAGAGAGAGTGVVLATRGEPAVLPAESVLTFRLTDSVKLN